MTEIYRWGSVDMESKKNRTRRQMKPPSFVLLLGFSPFLSNIRRCLESLEQLSLTP